MRQWLALFVLGTAFLTIGCQAPPAEPTSAPPAQPTASRPVDGPPADAVTAAPSAPTSSLTFAVLAIDEPNAKHVAAGMQQVAPANGVELKIVASTAEIAAVRPGAVLLVGPSADAAIAARAAKVPVVAVGRAEGRFDAHLANDLAIGDLTVAQATEAGRVAIETAASLVSGEAGVETSRPAATILPAS